MPFGGNLHIQKALTNYAIEYMNENYIFGKFPNVQVNKESDLYYTHVRDFRIPETLRANKSEANMKSWAVSTSSYSLDERALKDLVTDRDRANSDAIRLDQQTTADLTDDIMRSLEFEASKVLFTTGTWSNNTSLNTATSWVYNTTTSAPIQNVLSATSKIIQSSGMRPNTMIVGNATFDALKENQNIHERLKYVRESILTEQILASVFDMKDFIVGYSIYDSSQEGLAESITSIWGGNALICYLSQSPSMRDVSAFKQFRKDSAIKVKKWREEKLAGDMIEASTMQITKATATQAAYYFSSVTAI